MEYMKRMIEESSGKIAYLYFLQAARRMERMKRIMTRRIAWLSKGGNEIILP